MARLPPVRVTPRNARPNSPIESRPLVTTPPLGRTPQDIGGVPEIGASPVPGAKHTWALQPKAYPLLAFGAKSLYRAIEPNRQAEIYNSILQSQSQYRNMLARRSFGNLTPSDIQDIQQQTEPAVNAIAQGVQARGLGTSGAGAQVIANAQQQGFTDARREAQSLLPIYDNHIMQSAQQLMGDQSYFEDIDATIAYIIEEYTDDPESLNNDPQMSEMIRFLYNLFKFGGRSMPATQARTIKPLQSKTIKELREGWEKARR